MSDYNTIRGLRVRYLSADPAGAEDGQVWYNSASGNLRVEGIQGAAAWSSGGNVNTARRGIFSVKNATQTTALGAMGYTGSGTGVTNAEAYDGSSWSNITAVPSSRYFGGGFGAQTTAVVMGGYSTVPSAGVKDITNEWDGSSWALGGVMPTPGGNFAADGCGTQTAGLAAGPSAPTFTTTIEYNGSSWAAVPGSMNGPARTAGASFGTQTAAVATTGNHPSGDVYNTESYDGTSWTVVGNNIFYGYGTAAGGTQTAGFMMRGQNSSTAVGSCLFDGSSWTASANNANGRSEAGGAGSQSAGIAFAGATTNPTSYSAATEEFNIPVGTATVSVS